MSDEMEKYLSKFKLAEASPELEQKILANARANWQTKEDAEDLSPEFIRIVKIFFSAAAIILFAILILNSISFSRPERNMDKYDLEVEQLVELGISESKAEIMLLASAQPNINNIDRMNGIKEIP